MASRRHKSKKKKQQEGSTASPSASSGASRQWAREILQTGNRNGFGGSGGMWTGGLRGASAPSKAFGTPDSQTLQVEDGEVNAFFRQFSKRDPVTRVKALEQLTALVDRRSADELATVLHVWTLHFEKLAIDNDHRVRLHLIKVRP